MQHFHRQRLYRHYLQAFLSSSKCQVLEGVIKFRWKLLPSEQREGIRSYLVQKVITISQDERSLRAESSLVNKLNLTLVQVLKHEWPQNWPSFIGDIVGSSRTSEVLCENNVVILRLLSEEVFDFSKDSMTAAKAEALRHSLSAEFCQIFELFNFILQASTRPSLVCKTLQALQRYITWIPDQYVFETRLLETLCVKFFPVATFRIDTLMVLTEVAGLSRSAYSRVFEQLYISVLSQLVRFLPPDTTLRKVWRDLPPTEQTFIRHLALFFTTFFTSHVDLLEGEAYRSVLLAGLNYLVAISDLDDPEIFKICLEFWLHLSNDLYTLDCSYTSTVLSAPPGLLVSNDPVTGRSSSQMHPRKAVYAEVLSRVREVM